MILRRFYIVLGRFSLFLTLVSTRNSYNNPLQLQINIPIHMWNNVMYE